MVILAMKLEITEEDILKHYSEIDEAVRSIKTNWILCTNIDVLVLELCVLL